MSSNEARTGEAVASTLVGKQRKRVPDWAVWLNACWGSLADVFPEKEEDYPGSRWALWEKRIQQGQKDEEKLIRRIFRAHINRRGISPPGDIASWAAEEHQQVLHLTNAMYAALVVSIWSEIERFITDIVYASRLATGQGKAATWLPKAAKYPTVHAVRVLNNCFKHTEGRYVPKLRKPDAQIDQMLLDRWSILDGRNVIDYTKLPIKELVVACHSFCDDVLNALASSIEGNKSGE